MANAKRILKEHNGNSTTTNATATSSSSSNLENTMNDDVNVVSGSTLVRSNPNNISLVSYNDFTVSPVMHAYTRMHTWHVETLQRNDTA